jgi:hypothetical protein
MRVFNGFEPHPTSRKHVVTIPAVLLLGLKMKSENEQVREAELK